MTTWFARARSGELVEYLDDAEMARLLQATEVAEAGAGDYLLHKGSPSRSILLVEDGEIEIIDESLGEMVVLGSVGPGGVVGEVGFVDGQPRTHHVRAATACRVRRLTRDALLGLAQSDPALFAKVMLALAELMARRFRAVLAELDPVRAFAASLGAPDETAVDDTAPAPAPDADETAAADDAEPFEYDQIDDPLLDQAVEMLRELARRPAKDLAGV